MTFFVFSVFPAPDSPLRGENGIFGISWSDARQQWDSEQRWSSKRVRNLLKILTLTWVDDGLVRMNYQRWYKCMSFFGSDKASEYASVSSCWWFVQFFCCLEARLNFTLRRHSFIFVFYQVKLNGWRLSCGCVAVFFFIGFVCREWLTPELKLCLKPVEAICAKYWITFFVFSVLPAPLSPLSKDVYILVTNFRRKILKSYKSDCASAKYLLARVAKSRSTTRVR